MVIKNATTEPFLCKCLTVLVFLTIFLSVIQISFAATNSTEQAPQEASSDWLATVQKNIRGLEYRLTQQKVNSLPGITEAWQAPNQANGLCSFFISEGIRVTPSESLSQDWIWGMNFVGYAFEDEAITLVDRGNLSVSGNRIEYHRQGITEWYLNDVRGIEQGFTLKTVPQMTPGAPGAWLVLKMELLGNLKATLTKSGDGIDFSTPAGTRVLNYGKLQAVDAAGKHLATKLSLSGENCLLLMVDASVATYPIIIDPLLTSASWIQEGGRNGASFFGISVSTAGDVNGDGFSDVIVGARNRAFVYHGSTSGLSSVPAWTAEIDQASSYFDSTVASSAGDVNGDGYSDVIVGARYYNNGQKDEGRAFVYHGSANGLSTTPNWSAESNQDDAHFGYSVSTAGDVNGDGFGDVIVGAPYYSNGQSYEGAAFVYFGSTSGLSNNYAWSAEGDQFNARFSFSVSTAGDVNGDGYSDAIIGAPKYDKGRHGEGCAFVYFGSATGLSDSPAWSAGGRLKDDWFGSSVSTAGDVNGDGFDDAIVGAVFSGSQSGSQTGCAFVYYGSASGLNDDPAWSAGEGQSGSLFGTSVSTAGDVNRDGFEDVIVGATGYDRPYKNGAAFTYYGSASGLSNAYAWSAEGQHEDDFLGGSVSTAGDVNGDGLSDVIVGASGYENGQTDEGGVFVYLSSITQNFVHRGFDYIAYLAANPDLPSNWDKTECMNHYKLFGFSENRAVRFNIDEYLNANPDLPRNWTLSEGLNHYNIYGKFEHRILAFDAQEYLSLYADLPQEWTYEEAFTHYVNYGRNEGRIASFDETAYLELYEDLPSSWGQAEAFYHYLYYGQYENRVYDPYDEDVFDSY